MNAKYCLPSASVVGHKTNNGGRRNSTNVGVLKPLNGGMVENAKPLLRLLTLLLLPAFVVDYSGFMSRQCWSYDQHLFDWRGLFYLYIGCWMEMWRMLDNTYPPLRLLVEKTNNGGQRNSTKVGVLKHSTL